METTERTKLNLQSFQHALNRVDPKSPRATKIKLLKRPQDIELYPSSDFSSENSVPDVPAQHENQSNHSWLECMDAFAKEMSAIWKYLHVNQRSSTPKEPIQPITVALIDDGVELLDPAFQNRNYSGMTLSFDIADKNMPKTSQRMNPYHHSADGHGTVMASLIYRVCPMVKLYIIRIETRRDAKGKNRIVPHSAAAVS